MIHIVYVADSTKHFSGVVDEYVKRLGKSIKLQKITPGKWDKQKVVVEETMAIWNFLEKQKGWKVLLSLAGTQMKSEDFSRLLSEKQMEYADIIFVIWGAFGCDEITLDRYFDQKMALSEMTFPHSFALGMLLEQVYRGKKILEGGKYHH